MAHAIERVAAATAPTGKANPGGIDIRAALQPACGIDKIVTLNVGIKVTACRHEVLLARDSRRPIIHVDHDVTCIAIQLIEAGIGINLRSAPSRVKGINDCRGLRSSVDLHDERVTAPRIELAWLAHRGGYAKSVSG